MHAYGCKHVSRNFSEIGKNQRTRFRWRLPSSVPANLGLEMITIFTPSFADASDTNAQNLSVKEIVARLDPERFAVTVLHEGLVDSRIAMRPNTRLLRWRNYGNSLRVSLHLLNKVPDIYFFPREGP